MGESQEKLDFGQFENKSSNEEFLKLQDGKSVDVSFSKVEIISVVDEDKDGNPKSGPDGKLKMKPQLKFTTETVSGQPSEKTWRTGNRQIVATVKELVSEGTFKKWIYRITKNPPSGNSIYSSYVLTPIRPKA